MKKVFILFVFSVFFVSCTSNMRSRRFGGDSTVEIDPGYKVVEATWKEDNLWILVEPMEEDYEPKTKKFREVSNFGIFEGTIIFKEKR